MTGGGDAVVRKRRAVVGTCAMTVGPGMVAGAIPWLLTRWKVRRPVPGGTPARTIGAVLIGAAGAVLTDSFVRFVVEGVGTPAPMAPTEHLVVGGLYRHVRNPMYVALEAAIVGQALLLGQPRLLLYGALGAVPVVTFVRRYKEPTLARTFGAEYEQYRHNVPGWLPRLSPWRPFSTTGAAR